MNSEPVSAYTIYYWEFQSQGLTAYVASSNIGAVRVKIGFARDQSFMTELKKSFTQEAELLKIINIMKAS